MFLKSIELQLFKGDLVFFKGYAICIVDRIAFSVGIAIYRQKR